MVILPSSISAPTLNGGLSFHVSVTFLPSVAKRSSVMSLYCQNTRLRLGKKPVSACDSLNSPTAPLSMTVSAHSAILPLFCVPVLVILCLMVTTPSSLISIATLFCSFVVTSGSAVKIAP